MSQSDNKLRQKLVTVLCLEPLGSLEPGHYLFPEVTISDADLDKLMHLFAAEHARLLVSLREKMPEKIIDEGDLDTHERYYNEAVDDAHAAIDAELDRLTGGAGKG